MVVTTCVAVALELWDCVRKIWSSVGDLWVLPLVTLACLRKRLGHHQPLLCIQVALGPAVETLYPFAFLPQGVGCVSCMGLCVALINAAAADEGLEALFICSFVDG